MIRTTLLFSALALLVTACGSRTQFDNQLTEGCRGAIKHVLDKRDPAFELKNVLETRYTDSQVASGGRKVVMTGEIQAQNGSGFPEERDIVCHFQESISFAGIMYNPAFHQLKIGDTRYGRDADGDLINDIRSFTALSDAVAEALNNAG